MRRAFRPLLLEMETRTRKVILNTSLFIDRKSDALSSVCSLIFAPWTPWRWKRETSVCFDQRRSGKNWFDSHLPSGNSGHIYTLSSPIYDLRNARTHSGSSRRGIFLGIIAFSLSPGFLNNCLTWRSRYGVSLPSFAAKPTWEPSSMWFRTGWIAAILILVIPIIERHAR